MRTTTSSPAATRPTLETEWLLSDGFGGWAMGTARGTNTRCYHGLLIAAATPPTGRRMLLHSVVDRIDTDDGALELAAQLFGPGLHPHPSGHKTIRAFDFDGHRARWTFDGSGISVVRELDLLDAGEGVRLTWTVRTAAPGRLTVRLLTPLRNVHELSRRPEGAGSVCCLPEGRPAGLAVTRGEDALELTSSSGEFAVDPQWWNEYAYPEDRDRGQPWQEDVWSPGTWSVALAGAGEHVVALDARGVRAERAQGLPAAPADRGRTSKSGERVRLERAGAAFVVRRGTDGASIVAGYPWFADWGRDTMISLPGLLLTTGRSDVAQTVLETFATGIVDGLVPNCFGDHGAPPLYNTVDAGLWFIHAVFAHATATGARHARLIDAARSIIRAYTNGTRFGIHVDRDDLVSAGTPDEPITWMDAHRGGIAFTPRIGKAVEINGLWYNALCSLAALTADAEERERLRDRARGVRTKFVERFWWPERGALHDVLVEENARWTADGRFRPNQILVVGLPFSPVDDAQAASILAAVDRTLWTPFGLRTLEPDDPGFTPRFEGDLWQRDAAYHNGTVWPWLIGPFGDAWLRVHGRTPDARAALRARLQPLLDELDRGCLGQLPEVFDGTEPQRAAGCPAQAWSVAELLRLLALIEEN